MERGTTSTPWRDYVDILRLAKTHDIDDVLDPVFARTRGRPKAGVTQNDAP